MRQVIKRRGAVATVLVAVISVLAVTTVAHGQPAMPPGNRGETHIQGVRFDVHATLGWWWAFGAGFRVDIPIVKDGFVDSLDDELAITFGGDFQFVRWNDGRGCFRRNDFGCYGEWSVWPQVAAQWNIYLSEKFSVFPELGLAVGIHDCGFRDVCGTASPLISFGARWHFAPPRLALLLRLSFPFGFQVGLNF